MRRSAKVSALRFLLIVLCAVPLLSSEAFAQRRYDRFIVPDGTTIVAVLNNQLTTKTARDGDRFTLRVTSPGQFRGATIYGRVSNLDRGGRIKGRSQMSLNFDRIRLADGRSYNFAGIIDSVRTPNGETVRVDNEGSVQEGQSRGSTTAKRSGVGAAAGAVIGAIAGGGKGAAIGAIVGGGAGAGSVYIQGHDDLDLRTGTRVTIRASAPQ